MKTLKKYTTPKMEIVDMSRQNELLCASGPDCYWVDPPEPEEDCESNWWCGK